MGVWRKCITTKVTDMPHGWLDRAGVAIVGETGREVSNNHDVMSLEVGQTTGMPALFFFLRLVRFQLCMYAESVCLSCSSCARQEGMKAHVS